MDFQIHATTAHEAAGREEGRECYGRRTSTLGVRFEPGMEASGMRPAASRLRTLLRRPCARGGRAGVGEKGRRRRPHTPCASGAARRRRAAGRGRRRGGACGGECRRCLCLRRRREREKREGWRVEWRRVMSDGRREKKGQGSHFSISPQFFLN
ncbi:hypothetical protein DAI22_10g095901 [Oryza sativa Japonica Group]|nr:hypothetical protein DAI22_10g095901 [Oryza sativa Japonica Group]